MLLDEYPECHTAGRQRHSVAGRTGKRCVLAGEKLLCHSQLSGSGISQHHGTKTAYHGGCSRGNGKRQISYHSCHLLQGRNRSFPGIPCRKQPSENCCADSHWSDRQRRSGTANLFGSWKICHHDRQRRRYGCKDRTLQDRSAGR